MADIEDIKSDVNDNDINVETKEEDNKAITELEAKIIQQIEYYFSDINLSKDKFLKELLTKEDGWVPLETLLTFNRLKSLSEDKSVIVNALQKSESNLLEISECLNKIRRSLDKPLPEFNEEYIQELNERTVHLKGFPNDTKLDDIMNFCRQLGTVENIEMRRHFKSKQFKGCIFVVFSTKEDAEKVINTEDLKYLDNKLLKENKVNYFIRKKEFSDRKNSRKGAKNKPNYEKKSEEGVAEDNSNGVKTETKPVVNPVKYNGAVLKLKEIDESTDYKEIKKTFQQHGRVAYVEAVNDQKESFIRFEEKDGAKNALQKAMIVSDDKSDQKSDVIKVEINGKDVIAEVLTGEEEIQYWTDFERNRNKANEKRNEKKFQGRGGRKGKNSWQKGRKRGYKGDRGGGDRDDRREKRIKSDGD